MLFLLLRSGDSKDWTQRKGFSTRGREISGARLAEVQRASRCNQSQLGLCCKTSIKYCKNMEQFLGGWEKSVPGLHKLNSESALKSFVQSLENDLSAPQNRRRAAAERRCLFSKGRLFENVIGVPKISYSVYGGGLQRAEHHTLNQEQI